LQFLFTNRQKYKQKNAVCLADGLRFSTTVTDFYSKLPLACRVYIRRPPPTTTIFAVNLLHIIIKPLLANLVKKNQKNSTGLKTCR